MTQATYELPAEHAANLVDPAAYADGRVFETYAWLREHCPLGIARPEGFDPFWVASRFEDIRTISSDNKRFPYGDRNSMLNNQASNEVIRTLSGGKTYFARTLIHMDPPDHLKYRLVTQKFLTPSSLKGFEEKIYAIADAWAAKLEGQSRIEFAEEIAYLYPVEVIMTLLGLPLKDMPFVLKLAMDTFMPLDPDNPPEGVDINDPAIVAKLVKSVIDRVGDYFAPQVDDRRKTVRNDLTSLIANASIDGAPMPANEIIGYFSVLATAGHDTTASTASAAMYALATTPGLFDRIKNDRTLIRKLVEEAIRWATPVKTFMRTAAEDTSMGEVTIHKGDWIMLCYASGNRDESKFEDADKFDIDRPQSTHLSFGYGPHICLGQHLARLEVSALIERIITRLDTVELDGAPEFSHSFFVNGLKRLPLRYATSTDS